MQFQTLAGFHPSLGLCCLAVLTSASLQTEFEEDLCSVLQWPALSAAEDGLQKLSGTTAETQGLEPWDPLHSRSLPAEESRYTDNALIWDNQQLRALNAKLAQVLANHHGAAATPFLPQRNLETSQSTMVVPLLPQLAQVLARDRSATVTSFLPQQNIGTPQSEMVAPFLPQLAQVLATHRSAAVAPLLPRRNAETPNGASVAPFLSQRNGSLVQTSSSAPSMPQGSGRPMQVFWSSPFRRNVSLVQLSEGVSQEVAELLWKLPEAWALLAIGLATVLSALSYVVLGSTPWGFLQRLQGLSWETRRSIVFVLVIFGSIFYFMWCAGTIQPILNQILSYLVLAFFLLTLIAIALLEIWRLLKPTVMVPLAAMKRVHDRLVHMEQIVGSLSQREAQQLKDGTHPEFQNL
eukprot:TRINITY_DN487_c0_g1_i1.p1 TRINITY_DN487_c0_g1~~TRINITY_DN487_c0_g1_i1.p1  ORF type:complete len:407 (-),score=63.52 TRINITY_DN487_c0_g1_i1:36-1256(-)